MSREKEGFRETILALNEMFPEQGTLNKKEAAEFCGVSVRTIQRWGLKFNQHGQLTKADLARQICL